MRFSVLQVFYSSDIPEYLDDAIRSIIEQTLAPDELVLVQNGEITTELQTVIEKWREKLGKKMVLVVNDQNMGLAKALNIGLAACKYDYVARMDSDDISLPDRFEKQVEFLEHHGDIDLLGGWYRQMDESMERWVDHRKVPRDHENIVKYGRTRTPINHPTIIFRKSAVEAIGGYPDYTAFQEDWALTLTMIQAGYHLHNLQEYLVEVRGGNAFYNRRGGFKYAWIEQRTLIELLKRGLISLSDYVLNVAIRAPIRFLPLSLRIFFYRLIRKSKVP